MKSIAVRLDCRIVGVESDPNFFSFLFVSTFLITGHKQGEAAPKNKTGWNREHLFFLLLLLLLFFFFTWPLK